MSGLKYCLVGLMIVLIGCALQISSAIAYGAAFDIISMIVCGVGLLLGLKGLKDWDE